MQEEFEALIRDERQQHEDDTEMLSEELRDKDRHLQNYAS